MAIGANERETGPDAELQRTLVAIVSHDLRNLIKGTAELPRDHGRGATFTVWLPLGGRA